MSVHKQYRTLFLQLSTQQKFVKRVNEEINARGTVYLSSCCKSFMQPHSSLYILILEHPLLHTSCVNTQKECSPGPSLQTCESGSGGPAHLHAQAEGKTSRHSQLGKSFATPPIIPGSISFLKTNRGRSSHSSGQLLASSVIKTQTWSLKHIKQQRLQGQS